MHIVRTKIVLTVKVGCMLITIDATNCCHIVQDLKVKSHHDKKYVTVPHKKTNHNTLNVNLRYRTAGDFHHEILLQIPPPIFVDYFYSVNVYIDNMVKFTALAKYNVSVIQC